jgi:hypothetical protein
MHWTPEQWLTVVTGVIGAVASAIVTVYNAVLLQRHNQQAQARHDQVMAAVQTNKGGTT